MIVFGFCPDNLSKLLMMHSHLFTYRHPMPDCIRLFRLVSMTLSKVYNQDSTHEQHINVLITFLLNITASLFYNSPQHGALFEAKVMLLIVMAPSGPPDYVSIPGSSCGAP
ncbi:hypothetical protein FEM33_14070 [Dyadobacter flavalbus]|uniref:Uncharacterized protein n=1 Tax=Dyadobacter flavalbus TaxID=2579942 RepID=A0A5M8QZD4_9BACT|nr:hypothetical protein [Dyadobacter flavalbus]KAA6439382.1 hypothetical protein FEM33_14070 [Dyadobacter flavalbus]